MNFTASMGIAKPIPADAPEGEYIAVFIPINCPAEFKSGPPELLQYATITDRENHGT